MNAKKICALALSLGLSVSCAPKSDAGLIKDAFKAAGVYAGYKTASTLIPKYAMNYSGWWNLTVKKGGDLVALIKGYIDTGVDFSIKLAEQKFELEKKFGVSNNSDNNSDKNIDNDNDINDKVD